MPQGGGWVSQCRSKESAELMHTRKAYATQERAGILKTASVRSVLDHALRPRPRPFEWRCTYYRRFFRKKKVLSLYFGEHLVRKFARNSELAVTPYHS